ncbi:HNH endonuclease [Streptomyces sp. NPDC005840]|uniref:HNH endonuclease n=1 Tax=Streptomyces sp. NPDC005840 TaxID=3157072 RepID=UPI0033DECC14
MQKTCSIESCESVAAARGWCQTHYSRWTRTGDPGAATPVRTHNLDGPEASFWAKVRKTKTCWLWTAGQFGHSGYGSFSVKVDGRTRSVRTHRHSWELANGPIPEGKHVLHRCDTPLCVRPEHLFLGDALMNAQDKVAKGRLRRGDAKGEANGHAKLTETDVRAIRTRVAAGESQAALAREFRVTAQSVCDIVKRRRWKHVS